MSSRVEGIGSKVKVKVSEDVREIDSSLASKELIGFWKLNNKLLLGMG